MARTNRNTPRARNAPRTFNGADGVSFTPEQELRRATLSTFLFEDQYYEGGEKIADRIADLACKVTQEQAEALAIEARTQHNLRHVPMWVLTSRMRNKQPVSREAVAAVLQRADEPGEFISQYWSMGKKPIPAQAKRGIADAMKRFDAYQLAKYDRTKDTVKIRDVMRLVHPTPLNAEQGESWRKLIAGELEAPDTWEVALSGGADKKETFTRLLTENKLGYMALLRNLRNMREAGVDKALVERAIRARRGAHRVLPFRYISAAYHAPEYTDALNDALVAQIADMEPLSGKTVVCVDLSGSMQAALSGGGGFRAPAGTPDRVDAAATLAACIPGNVKVIVYGSTPELLHSIPQGIEGAKKLRAMIGKNGHGTETGRAVRLAEDMDYDRLIVITDEQTSDSVYIPNPSVPHYMINVAAAKNGSGFGNWVRIDGFSAETLKFIRAYEDSLDEQAVGG